LVATVYGPLTGELARTLTALVEHGFDKSAAAAALPVHRNTLNYRVAQIEQRTGLDLRAPRDRGLAWLASLA
jgi:DNA-binding PucR family transcriptional regulator